jgi:hypothetical protein
MSKELTIRLADEMWEAFRGTCMQRHGVKSPDPEHEARDVMCGAIKAYVLKADLGEEPRRQRVPEPPEPAVYPYDPGRTLSERSRRKVICEAYAIAETCPGMVVEELRHGWVVMIPGIYHRETEGASGLFKAVKEGKELDETLREIKAKGKPSYE